MPNQRLPLPFQGLAYAGSPILPTRRLKVPVEMVAPGIRGVGIEFPLLLFQGVVSLEKLSEWFVRQGRSPCLFGELSHRGHMPLDEVDGRLRVQEYPRQMVHSSPFPPVSGGPAVDARRPTAVR